MVCVRLARFSLTKYTLPDNARDIVDPFLMTLADLSLRGPQYCLQETCQFLVRQLYKSHYTVSPSSVIPNHRESKIYCVYTNISTFPTFLHHRKVCNEQSRSTSNLLFLFPITPKSNDVSLFQLK